MGTLISTAMLLVQAEPGGPWGPGYHWGWGMMGGGWGIFMMVFMFLFWAVIIVGIVALVRYVMHAPAAKTSDDALEILRSRYARGEIEKSEFDEKRKDLTS
jgi:putative membrane protein